MRREEAFELGSSKPGDRTLRLRPVSHWAALRSSTLRQYRPDDSPHAARLSQQVRILERRLRRAHHDGVMALITAVEAKDPHSEQHAYHVAAYAERLGNRLHLSPSKLEIVVIAALLHDIGKIGVPDAVLTKPGPLTAEEYGLVKLHSAIGETILKPVGFLEPARTLVRHHHEWYDGRGYPDGLAGDRIPLGARILQVADSIDAMVTPRSYKSGRCADEVIAELVRCRGTQFDPAIADLAIDWLRQSPHELLSPKNKAHAPMSTVAC